MNGALILLTVLAAAYPALNVVRLFRGRPWAFTVCQVAKEWESSNTPSSSPCEQPIVLSPARIANATKRPSGATLGAAFLNGTPSSRDTVLTCHVTRRPAVRSRPHTQDCAPMCGGRPLVEAAKAGDRRARGQLIEAYRAARAVTPRSSIGVRRL